MNKHDNIYNILGKLASLEPQPPKQESILKQLNEGAMPAPTEPQGLKARLEARFAAIKEEKQTMSRAAKGNEKYGKDGMKALAKAGRDGASEKELDKIRDRHDKYDESVEVDEDMLAKKDYDGDGKKESPKDEYMGSRDKAIKKAMGKDKEKTDEDAVPGKSWVKDPQDPASKVPAYQRKANEPGRQAAQDRADAANDKAGAKVFRSGRAAPMEEEQYDENDAHSSLPSMRKTSDDEHSEYDAAAHTIRKWMRKRGWDTNKEFKPALKYIMDNLEDKHDDSLTDQVKEAAKICEKHHMAVAEAGLDMNLLKGAQGAMQGANTDPESERNRGKKYGYRSDRDDTGNDDDYDEHGNEKKGAKKSAPSDGPKKKGRPKKNFGPERTTANAWKHKGERKTNESRAIDLEHYVEDTIQELEAMFIIEKAKSKSQQRFFGMVHAAQKGEKPASKEVAKVAKSMGKKDAKDFAKTKHKGLPDKVSEGINYAEMMRETNQTVEEMLNELHSEMDEYKRTGYLGDKLRDALDIHRHSKKLMDNQIPPMPELEEVPAASTETASTQPANIQPASAQPVNPNSLSELAKLAGIEPIQEEPNEGNEFSGARAAAIRAGKETFSVGGKTYQVTDAEDEKITEGGCNMTAEGQYCPEHGMNECGMMYEGAKPDYIDLDKDGNKKEPMKKAAKDAKTEGKKSEPYKPDPKYAKPASTHKYRDISPEELKASREEYEKKYGKIKNWTDTPHADSLKEDLQADDGQHYEDEADFFGQFEADHFDNEVESDDGMEVRGYIDGVNVMAWRFDDESKTSGYGVYNDDMLAECGMPGDMGGMSQDDGISINTSMDTKSGRKTVTVTADGEAAEELASILKMAGMVGKKPEPKVISLDQDLEEYANEPDERYAGTDAILKQGNDLNKPKKQDPGTANRAANPLGETAVQEDKLFKLYKSLKDIV